jgi:hypothetical protein
MALLKRKSRAPQLHHVTVEILYAQLDECLDFYWDVLLLHAAKPKFTVPENSLWFEEGVHLYWGTQRTEPLFTEPAAQHFALHVGSLYERIRVNCISRNLWIVDGKEYWKSRRCFVHDPCLNRIELLETAP